MTQEPSSPIYDGIDTDGFTPVTHDIAVKFNLKAFSHEDYGERSSYSTKIRITIDSSSPMRKTRNSSSEAVRSM